MGGRLKCSDLLRNSSRQPGVPQKTQMQSGMLVVHLLSLMAELVSPWELCWDTDAASIGVLCVGG